MPWRRRRRDADFAREIDAHIDLETERLIEEGLNPAEAASAARRRFGNVAGIRERHYESARVLWLDRLQQDLRTAARNFVRHPVGTAVAVLSLALGIGITTSMLTVRNAVFVNAPPLYRQPDDLSKVRVILPGRLPGRVRGALFNRWMEDPALVRGMAAGRSSTPAEVRWQDVIGTVPVQAVTTGLFGVLGVNAQVGRTFSDATDAGDGPTPAVLSFGVWRDRFDGRSDVIGASVRIENQPYTIVGVMPERFWFSSMDDPIWVPLRAGSVQPDEWLSVVVRRQPGVTSAILAEALQRGVTEYASRLAPDRRQLRAHVSRMSGTPIGEMVSFVYPWLIGVSVLLTLLIACANVAILMFAQWTAREHEIAVRVSLGAGRARLIRQLLTETGVVAAAGGLLGLAATFALRAVIVRQLPVAYFDFSIDSGILFASAAITLVTGVLVGIAPALVETRRLQANPGLAKPSDRVRQRWRHSLVVLEVAVTVALLVVTTTMVDAYRRGLFVDPGFPARPLMIAAVDNAKGIPIAQMLERLEALPGVASVAASTSAPFWAPPPMVGVGVDTAPGPPAGTPAPPASPTTMTAERSAIGPGLFTTLRVPLVAGREFSRADAAAGTNIAVVNEKLARRLWPGVDAVGRSVRVDNVAFEVIGVVRDFSHFPLRQPVPTVFVPIQPAAAGLPRVQFILRADANPASLVLAPRRAIQDLGTGSVVSSSYTFAEFTDIVNREYLSGAYPMFPLIAIGIFLTAAGVYGVLAFAIARRSKELALRMAIGATGRDLVWLVASSTVRLIAIATSLGVAVTFGLSRVVRSLGGSGSVLAAPGWLPFVVPVLIIAGVAVLATWIPSRRALKIDPAVLLRSI